jgi:hypothetical protein
MRARRAEFTDEQKAEIYVRDRALCSYSGLSTWLLDYGASYIFNIDWVDHIRPAAQGGRADLDNGACACGFYNLKKRSGSRVRLFSAGQPTAEFLYYHGAISMGVAQHLRRFAKLHYSDWYFNRAVFHTLLGALRRFEKYRADGQSITRGTEYRANAVLKFLSKWRKFLDAENIPSMKKRGLLPSAPSPDQKILLRLVQATTAREINHISKALAPYIKASGKALDRLAEVTSSAKAKALLVQIKRDRFVTVYVRRIVELNLRRLGLLSKGKARARKTA